MSLVTAAQAWRMLRLPACSVIFPDVEAGDLAIPQVEDVTDRFVLEPVRLILQRPALQIPYGGTP